MIENQTSNSMIKLLILTLLFPALFFSQCRMEIPPVETKQEDTIPKLEYDKNGVKISMPYLWKIRTNNNIANGSTIMKSVIYDDKVLLGAGFENQAGICLLDINDGHIIWKKPFFDTWQFSIPGNALYQYKNQVIFQYGTYYNLDMLTGEFIWKKKVVLQNNDVSGIDSLYFVLHMGEYEFNKDSIYGLYYGVVDNNELHEIYVPDLGKIYFEDWMKYNGPGGIRTVTPYWNSKGEIMILFYVESFKDSSAGDFWLDLYNFTQKKFVFQYDTIRGGLGAWPPLVHNNKVYHTIGDTTGVRIQCIELDSGKVIWSHETGLYTGLYGSVIAEGMHISVVGDMEQYLIALDLETGAVIWRHPTSAGRLSSKMSYLNGVVYFTSATDSKIHAFEAATGKDIWIMDAPDYSWDNDDYLSGWSCGVVPGKDGEKGKIIVKSLKHAYCFEAER